MAGLKKVKKEFTELPIFKIHACYGELKPQNTTTRFIKDMRVFILVILIGVFAGCASSKKRTPIVSRLEPLVETRETVQPPSVEPAVGQKPSHLETIEPPKPQAVVTNVVAKTNKWVVLDSVADKSWTMSYFNNGYPKRVVIVHREKTIELVEDTQTCKYDGIVIHLGYSPRWQDGRCLIHCTDFVSTIQPLIEGKPVLNRKNPLITIDPGHGGSDPGASNILNGKPEKDYTLDIARRLSARLESYGWGVVLTRSNDVRVERAERVMVSQKSNPDAFVSIHLNYFDKSVNVQGIETYCLTPNGLPSTLNRGFADNISTNYVNNAFDCSNIALAAEIHKSIVKNVKPVDRGVRRVRFIEVLQNQRCPAVLVEACYLSSRNEAALIEKPEYRQAIAEAIAEGLKNLYNRGN